MLLTPSIASANQLALGFEIEKLGGWPRLHLDIEDGNFVPNITFGMKTVWSIAAAASGTTLDVHLMTNDPVQYIMPLAECGIAAICAHIEALEYPMVFVNRARSAKMRVGLALNMKTDIRSLLPFVSLLDYVLIMTSEPDDTGELFFPPMLGRITEARALLPSQVSIHADGGINAEWLKKLSLAGVDEAVLGRAAFCTNDHYANLTTLSGMIP